MSELTKRIVSGVVMAVVLLGDLWLGSWWYLALLIIGGALVFCEYVRLTFAITTVAAHRAIWLTFGVVYVALAMHGLWQTRANPFIGLMLAVWLFLVVWATDVGAYMFGRLIGGPKIAPSISPSKTWAGLFGAILCVAIVMNVMFFGFAYGGPMSVEGVLVLGLLWGAPLAVLAQIGDFFESWMKRRAGVKDSGALIPGHGGLFDRVDGLLPVAIVFYPWIGEGLFR